MCIMPCMKNKIYRLFSLILGLCLFLFPLKVVFAASISSYDLIAALNDFRDENGQDSVPTNVFLMASAQSHANYLASTYAADPPTQLEGNVGLDGSDATERAETAGYVVVPGLQVLEVWAAETPDTPVDTLLSDVWGSATQQDILLNSYAVHIGVGVAEIEELTYYVVNIAVDYGSSPNETASVGSTETPEVVPVDVATQAADGSIIHEVVKGQALWSIAITYGVTVDELRVLNNLSANAAIYEGQKIIVRAAHTPTPSPLPTNTSMPATRTPIPAQAPQELGSPSAEVGEETAAAPLNMRTLGIGLIVLCGVGLIYLVYSMLRKRE